MPSPSVHGVGGRYRGRRPGGAASPSPRMRSAAGLKPPPRPASIARHRWARPGPCTTASPGCPAHQHGSLPPPADTAPPPARSSAARPSPRCTGRPGWPARSLAGRAEALPALIPGGRGWPPTLASPLQPCPQGPRAARAPAPSPPGGPGELPLSPGRGQRYGPPRPHPRRCC